MVLIQPAPDRDGLVAAYAYPLDRTWLRANFIATVDGAATGTDGVSGSIAAPVDQRVFRILRSLADVILVGAGTARREGYDPARAGDLDADLRNDLGLAPRPPIALVSRSLDLPESLVHPPSGAARSIVITSASAPAERREELAETVDLLVVGEHEIDLRAARAALAARGLNRILCEGGPSLFADLIDADLVDELCLTVVPEILGGASPRIATGPVPGSCRPMRLGHVLHEDDVLLTRYVRDRT